MILLLDTSVWVEHLRHGALDALLPEVRRRFSLRVDAVVASELRAGCRSKRERRVVQRLLAPFERAERIVIPGRADFERASRAISMLRERGRTLSKPGSALLDGLIGAVAVRLGALLVSRNLRDFMGLCSVLPLQVDSLEEFTTRIASPPRTG